MLTKKECQRKIFNLGLKYGVSPKRISTHLLSECDKEDMINGVLKEGELEEHVKVWVEYGAQCL